jgi:hypothetical protein
MPAAGPPSDTPDAEYGDGCGHAGTFAIVTF